MKRFRILAVAVLAGLCGQAAAAAVQETKGIAWEPSGLTAGEGRTELGWLAVPERRSQPGKGLVRLAVLRFPSASSSPAAPIVFLSGGPGGSGIAAARGPLLPVFLELRQAADVLVLDQRGTGMSKPSLVCRESWSHPLDRAVPREELLEAARQRSRSCAAMLRSEGVDLAGYNTDESADDLEDLRQALGVPRLQLLGSSYGSQLALAALRRHPGSFDRAVLLSPKGPEHGLRPPSVFDRQLKTIDRLVQDGAKAGGGAARGFLTNLTAVLKRLEKEPQKVDVPIPVARRTEQLLVGPFDLQAMVVQSLGSRQETALLPSRVQAMAKGDFEALGRFALSLRRGWLGSAMPYAVECASGAGGERRERVRREALASLLGEAVNFPFPEICAGWDVPDLGPGWREPVRSPVPVLLVAGTQDVRTPPENAEEIRRGLARGTLLTVDGAGHGEDFLAAPRVLEAVRDFFSGRAVTSRPVALPALDFHDGTPES